MPKDGGEGVHFARRRGSFGDFLSRWPGHWVNLSREVSHRGPRRRPASDLSRVLWRLRVNSAWLIAAGALAGLLFF